MTTRSMWAGLGGHTTLENVQECYAVVVVFI